MKLQTLITVVVVTLLSYLCAAKPPEFKDCCGAILGPEYRGQIERMLADGSWHEITHRDLSGIRGTTYVMTTFHILRYSNGNGGMSSSYCQLQIDYLNSHVSTTGLQFCIQDIIYHDLADPSVTYPSSPSYGFDPNSMNVYCTPNIEHSFPICGYASYPNGTTFVVQNNCMGPGTTTFSHEAGHYFGLPHTFEGTEDGSNPECVDGSNCNSAGDYFCDTAADDNGGWNGNCNYIGGGVDVCNGDPYNPNDDNLMSYGPDWCTDEFTPNQLSAFLYIAQAYRANILSSEPCVPNTGACCNESDSCLITYESMCESVGWIWQGQGTICDDGCLQNADGACCVGTFCLILPESNCNAGGGIWLGPNTTCDEGTCDEEPCESDLNGDSVVNVTDLLIVVEQWGNTSGSGDINGDGIVNVADLLLIVEGWGDCP